MKKRRNPLDRFVKWLAIKNGTASNSEWWEKDMKATIIVVVVILMIFLIMKLT